MRDDKSFISGNGVALRLDAIDTPCDRDYEAYYEDVAQGWRLRLSGYEIVVQPRARLRVPRSARRPLQRRAG